MTVKSNRLRPRFRSGISACNGRIKAGQSMVWFKTSSAAYSEF